MIPSPWTFALLTLAAYRLVRLIGWDDWPPIARARGRLIGEHWIATMPVIRVPASEMENIELTVLPRSQFPQPEMQEIGEPPELPGKTPTSEADAVRPAYDRPTLAHLIHCPFCLGWWVSVTGWAAWLAWPHAVTWLAVPFAAAGLVGLIAKVLDP